jgi:hypothetical protein
MISVDYVYFIISGSSYHSNSNALVKRLPAECCTVGMESIHIVTPGSPIFGDAKYSEHFSWKIYAVYSYGTVLEKPTEVTSAQLSMEPGGTLLCAQEHTNTSILSQPNPVQSSRLLL